MRVHVLSDGRFALDGGALFGVVPRALWEKADPPDARNRVTLGLNVLLVESDGKRVLIDTGIGDNCDAKRRDIYAIDRSTTLLSSLSALGLGPEDVDFVINTHLHFDHAGGNTRRDADGRWVPTFPRARYVVQLGEWEDAMQPNARSRASYREESFVPLAEAHQLMTLQGEAEVVPGVRVRPVGGHTAYHQLVVVEGGGRLLFAPTDLLPTRSHLPIAWTTGFDVFPLGSLHAKERLLEEAVSHDALVLFYHDVRVPLGRLRKEKGRFVCDEVRHD